MTNQIDLLDEVGNVINLLEALRLAVSSNDIPTGHRDALASLVIEIQTKLGGIEDAIDVQGTADEANAARPPAH